MSDIRSGLAAMLEVQVVAKVRSITVSEGLESTVSTVTGHTCEAPPPDNTPPIEVTGPDPAS